MGGGGGLWKGKKKKKKKGGKRKARQNSRSIYDRKYGRACIPTLTLFMHVNKKETVTKRPSTQTNKNAVSPFQQIIDQTEH